MRKIKFILAYFCKGLILHFPVMVCAQSQQLMKTQNNHKIDPRTALQVASKVVSSMPSVQIFLNMIEKSVEPSAMKIIRNYFTQSGVDLNKPFEKTKFLEDGSIQIGASDHQARLLPNMTIEFGPQKKIWQPQSQNVLEKNLKSLSDFFKDENSGSIKSRGLIWLFGQEAQARENKSMQYSVNGNATAMTGALLLVLSFVTEGALAIGLAVGGWALLGVGLLCLMAALVESYGIEILPDLRDGKAKVTFEGGWPVVSRGNVKVEPKPTGVTAQVKQALMKVISSLQPKQLEEAAKGLPEVLAQKIKSATESSKPAVLPTNR